MAFAFWGKWNFLNLWPIRKNKKFPSIIDGFNLYYGCLKGSPYKWLDIKKLSTQLFDSFHEISKIKYFIARVSGAVDPDAPRRQQIYLNALSTIPEVEVHFGKFLPKTLWRPLINLPIGNKTIRAGSPIQLPPGVYDVVGQNNQRLPIGNYPTAGGRRPRKVPKPLDNAVVAEVHSMEEKGSDVNLAAHMLNDAWKGRFDVALVVSNDTDLVTPIQMVSVERGLKVVVACPGRWGIAPALEKVANSIKHIHVSMLKKAQFPEEIPGSAIKKPSSW